jgi:hypothetical protein
MNQPKFSKGEQVRVQYDLPLMYGGISYTFENKRSWAGKVCTIQSVEERHVYGYDGFQYTFVEDNGEWHWIEETLEAIESEVQFDEQTFLSIIDV